MADVCNYSAGAGGVSMEREVGRLRRVHLKMMIFASC